MKSLPVRVQAKVAKLVHTEAIAVKEDSGTPALIDPLWNAIEGTHDHTDRYQRRRAPLKARSARIDYKQRRGGRRVQLVLSIEQGALDEPDPPTEGYNPSFRSDFSGFKGQAAKKRNGKIDCRIALSFGQFAHESKAACGVQKSGNIPSVDETHRIERLNAD